MKTFVIALSMILIPGSYIFADRPVYSSDEFIKIHYYDSHLILPVITEPDEQLPFDTSEIIGKNHEIENSREEILKFITNMSQPEEAEEYPDFIKNKRPDLCRR